MLARVTTLLLLLASTAWLASEPGWESGIVAAGFLAAFVAQEVRRLKRIPHPHDVGLFDELLHTLPPPTVENVRTHAFGSPIRTSDLHPLWEDAKYEPPDFELPKHVREAVAEIEQLAGEVAERYRALVEAGRTRLGAALSVVPDP